MQVYAVVATNNPTLLKQNVSRQYPSSHLNLSGDVVLIAASGHTSQSLAASIGIGSPPSELTGVVIAVDAYWGYHDPALWEWLRAKAAQVG